MKLFSIFGNPVSHSISPKMHNNALNDLSIDGCYIRKQILEAKDVLDTFKELKLDGANVTVPHKEAAFEQCDEPDFFASNVGAVNTLVNKNGKVYGYNTDAPGFYKAIESFGKINSTLILGAGGTAKAIATILKKNKINVTILNRSHSRLKYFEDNGFTCYDWETFTPDKYDLIVNTTSAGLSDNSYPLSKDLLVLLMQKAKFAFDVIYNKQTPFLQCAKDNNLIYKDGADMLLYQGVLAFNLFFDNQLDEKLIEKAMRKAFL